MQNISAWTLFFFKLAHLLNVHSYHTWTETNFGDKQKPDSHKTSKYIIMIYQIYMLYCSVCWKLTSYENFKFSKQLSCTICLKDLCSNNSVLIVITEKVKISKKIHYLSFTCKYNLQKNCHIFYDILLSCLPGPSAPRGWQNWF